MIFNFDLPRHSKCAAANMVLNSNDRWHRQVEAKMIAKIKDSAFWTVLATMDKDVKYSPDNPCEVLVRVYPPTKRRLDPPNLYPTVKAIIDAMTAAELWEDDDYKTLKRLSFEYGGTSGKKGIYRFEFEVRNYDREP